MTKDNGGKGGEVYPYIAEGLRHLATPIAQLVPDAANARRHGPKNLDAIKASLTRWGQRAPIVVQRKGNIVRAGNGRLEAAKALGWTHLAAVVVDDDSADAVAFALADNRTAELAEWDDATLATLLDSMPKDLAAEVGFDQADIDELMRELTPEVVEDEVPEPPANPVTKPGDLWMLGDHRVLCGDSTKAEDVARLMDGQRANIMLTDPPYGVEYDPEWRAEVNKDGPNSKRAVGKVKNDDRADWREAWKLFAGDVAYVWHADAFSPVVAESLVACGFEIRYLIIWAKQRHTFGRGHYHHQHEPCWFVARKGAQAHWIGDRTQTTLWQIDNNRNNDTGHSTQKPIECMARAIRNHDAPLVYDPFLGSGTTLIASEHLGRKCYGMEISPQYVDVIVQRWQTITGKEATLEDGTTWSEAKERTRG
jgi:DNA modification methylase